MIQLRNAKGLPGPLVEAMQNDPYSAGDSDITTNRLISPPHLEAQLWHYRKMAERDPVLADALAEDASDRIWSLLGQSVHTILERTTSDRYVREERHFIMCRGWKVSGAVDLYDKETKTQSDYKVTSAWSVKDGFKPEWEQQLNINTEFMEMNGHPVERLEIVAILRDWSRAESLRDPNYPRQSVVVVPIPLWSREKRKAFILERVKLHQEARAKVGAGNTSEVPVCTPDERWERPGKWAVKKPGGVRAVKLFDDEKEAIHFLRYDLGGKGHVEARPGVAMRCEGYCALGKAGLCQFKNAQKGEG